MIRTDEVNFSALRKVYEINGHFLFFGEVCYSVEKVIKV